MEKQEREAGERLATKFQQLETTELKQGALTVLSAYINGVMEERARWEHKLQTT